MKHSIARTNEASEKRGPINSDLDRKARVIYTNRSRLRKCIREFYKKALNAKTRYVKSGIPYISGNYANDDSTRITIDSDGELCIYPVSLNDCGAPPIIVRISPIGTFTIMNRALIPGTHRSPENRNFSASELVELVESRRSILLEPTGGLHDILPIIEWWGDVIGVSTFTYHGFAQYCWHAMLRACHWQMGSLSNVRRAR